MPRAKKDKTRADLANNMIDGRLGVRVVIWIGEFGVLCKKRLTKTSLMLKNGLGERKE